MFQTRRVQKHLFIYSFSKIRIFVTKVFKNPFQNPLLEDPAYSAWLSGQKVFESYFKSQKCNLSIFLWISHPAFVAFFKRDQVLATSNVWRGVNRQRQIEFDKNLRKARNAKTLHLGPLSLRQNLLWRIPVSLSPWLKRLYHFQELEQRQNNQTPHSRGKRIDVVGFRWNDEM